MINKNMNKLNSTVMIIEDESLLLDVISKKIKKSGLISITCTSGEKAIEKLKKMTEMPEVIWLDYHLRGGMDGLEFLQEIKANVKWSGIPVVVVSNSASSDEVHHMLALGVNKYILKAEYRLDQIIETIMKFVNDGEK